MSTNYVKILTNSSSRGLDELHFLFLSFIYFRTLNSSCTYFGHFMFLTEPLKPWFVAGMSRSSSGSPMS